jgi:hypothetical protein
LMRNGRDRRSGEPVPCHAIDKRVLLIGTRSADYIRASSQSGCIERPNTWLHPNASLNVRFLLQRGRRPYMARSVVSSKRDVRFTSWLRENAGSPRQCRITFSLADRSGHLARGSLHRGRWSRAAESPQTPHFMHFSLFFAIAVLLGQKAILRVGPLQRGGSPSNACQVVVAEFVPEGRCSRVRSTA